MESNKYLFTVAELDQMLNDVRMAEREACAQMIESAPPLITFCRNEHGGCVVCGFTPRLAAAAIREREQQ